MLWTRFLNIISLVKGIQGVPCSLMWNLIGFYNGDETDAYLFFACHLCSLLSTYVEGTLSVYVGETVNPVWFSGHQAGILRALRQEDQVRENLPEVSRLQGGLPPGVPRAMPPAVHSHRDWHASQKRRGTTPADILGHCAKHHIPSRP